MRISFSPTGRHEEPFFESRLRKRLSMTPRCLIAEPISDHASSLTRESASRLIP
jgi:hypothetical protein